MGYNYIAMKMHVNDLSVFMESFAAPNKLRLLNVIYHSPPNSISVKDMETIFSEWSEQQMYYTLRKLREANMVEYTTNKWNENNYYICLTGLSKIFTEQFIKFWLPSCIEWQVDLKRMNNLLEERSNENNEYVIK